MIGHGATRQPCLLAKTRRKHLRFGQIRLLAVNILVKAFLILSSRYFSNSDRDVFALESFLQERFVRL